MKIFTSIRYTALFCTIVFTSFVRGFAKESEFLVIKGKVDHFNGILFHFSLTGLFENQDFNVNVTQNGTFYKKVSLAEPEDLLLFLNNDKVAIYVKPGDTLDLKWDDRAAEETLHISTSKYRQADINLMLELHKKFGVKRIAAMDGNRSKQIPDSVKFMQVKELFSSEIKTIIASVPRTNKNLEPIIYDIYFYYLTYCINPLNRAGHNYQLLLKEQIPDSLVSRLFENVREYDPKTLYQWLFLNSPAYRYHISYLVQKTDVFNNYAYSGRNDKGIFNNTMTECYKGVAFFDGICQIRDWYLARKIIDDFSNCEFEKVEQAYFKFLPEIKTMAYKTALQHFHARVLKIKPGKPAPNFTLKDETGKLVSLSDFKGKNIFIEFWIDGFIPLHGDTIENYYARMREKYGNVVFINVCVQAKDNQWKRAIDQRHFEGVNLVADGWTNNPVCKAYFVAGVPHFILINAKGDIVNTKSPLELLGLNYTVDLIK